MRLQRIYIAASSNREVVLYRREFYGALLYAQALLQSVALYPL